jgi:type I restriction enzyme M protein
MAGKERKQAKTDNGASLGFEEKLWAAADMMRGHLDPAEYKHVALGLIFLKYISDAFQERYDQLKAEAPETHADPEDPDEYLAENVFWVPPAARWPHLQANAKQPEIGKLIDEAMLAIERANPSLKGVLPKDYARPALDKHRLGQLVDKIGSVGFASGETSIEEEQSLLFAKETRVEQSRSKDILGRTYEYFLKQFASAEGKRGGDFYTPQSVVRLLVEMLEPYKGRVYDPCCGSGGMFVQSEKFIEQHGGRRTDISIYGQEFNDATWRLAKMNLAIRGIEANLGPERGDTFLNDFHKDLKADFILANPPFNMSYWGGEQLREDVRWAYGVPPAGNANFAWLQHILHHLAPGGVAGVVLANGSMSSNTGGEGEIRRRIIEADLVDCMIALPPQLFYHTQVPACLWFLARNKENGKFRDRRRQTLFIDARKLGVLVTRTLRELLEAEEIARIAGTYHAWRGQKGAGEYKDVPGFCKSASLEEIAAHGYVLTPGRYVGAEEAQEDDEPFAEKMARLTATLREQMAEGDKLNQAIGENLRSLGFWK